MASSNSYTGFEPRVVALVRHHARRLAACDCLLEQEDAEQELAAHLHLRADRFELGRASRATYHDRLVRHRAADLARNARAAKRGPAPMLSLEDLHPERSSAAAGSQADHEDGAPWEDVAALRCDLVRFLASQPPRLQECCLLLLTHSVADTARMLGHHRSSIYAWLATLRERGSAAGLRIYLSTTPTDPVPAE
jgi:hypothetical protein